MRRRGVLAALGAAVTLAGCSGLGEMDEPAERVTPAPVPTDRPMPHEGPPVYLSLSAAASGLPVEVQAAVERERLADAPSAPSWVSTAREESG